MHWFEFGYCLSVRLPRFPLRKMCIGIFLGANSLQFTYFTQLFSSFLLKVFVPLTVRRACLLNFFLFQNNICEWVMWKGLKYYFLAVLCMDVVIVSLLSWFGFGFLEGAIEARRCWIGYKLELQLFQRNGRPFNEFWATF